MLLRRPTRPQDRHMGAVYGEDPRPVLHTSGPHAGHTVVQVQAPHARDMLVADGWVQVDGAPGPVGAPATLAEAMVRGSVVEIQAHLVPGLALGVVREALEFELRGGARTEVLEILGQYLEDEGHTGPAVEVLPPSLEAPLLPTRQPPAEVSQAEEGA